MASKSKKSLVARHIADYSVERSGRTWLPAVFSESDDDLDRALVSALGTPVPSGYMSEECGWWIETQASK